MTTFALFVIALGVAFVLAGVLALRDARAHRARRARAVPATGVVVSVQSDDNQSQTPVVRYRDASGVEHDAASVGTRPRQQLARGRFARGQQVRLRYDPERPSWVLVDGTGDPAGISRVIGVVALVVGTLVLAVDGVVHLLG
jgi:hypothetical protein